MKIKSIFEAVSIEVFQMDDVSQMKSFVTNYVTDKKINDIDKKRIINNVAAIKSTHAFHRYICNALLKYEGMGVSRF